MEKRLRVDNPNDDSVLHRRSGSRQHPRTRRTLWLIERMVFARDHPPYHLRRTPGPKAILYYLAHDETLSAYVQELPRSTRIDYQIRPDPFR